MAIESSIFPLPSEIILIPAGFAIALGKMSFIMVLIASIIGSIIGALFNYYLAFFLGRKVLDRFLLRYKSFLFINKNLIDKTENFFKNNGEITTFTGRLILGVRHLISLPAGFARMNLFKFCFYTGLGAGIWTIVLLGLGIIFKNNLDLILANSKIISYLFLLFCLIIILIYIIIKQLKKRKIKSINNSQVINN
jgi:membrane protein DedA with SNARE-associated domain